MNRDVAIVIPAHNEGRVIRRVLEGVLRDYELVICVDDGSTDDTRAEIGQTEAMLVSHAINLGQGAALQTGIQYGLEQCDAEFFVTFDADGQHRLDDVARMLQVIRRGDVDVVLGSRFLGRGTHVSPMRTAILRLAAAFGNLTAGVKLTDAHNGLRVFTRSFAQGLRIRMADMAHASEIVHAIGSSGCRYAEVPVTIEYTEYSKQKGQSLYNSVNIVFDLLLNSAGSGQAGSGQ